jgi:hypothetical protein
MRGDVVLTRWWSEAGVDFRPENDAPAPGLSEPVRTLEARLRHISPAQLTPDEAQALQGLLQTVHRLTQASLSGRG